MVQSKIDFAAETESTAVAPSTPDSPPAPPRDPHWRDAIRAGLIYWLLGRILVVVVEFMSLAINDKAGRCHFDPAQHGPLAKLLYQLGQWDACNYAMIAMQGYRHSGEGAMATAAWPPETHTAWPPGFALFTRAFDFVLPGTATPATVVAANVAAIALMIMLARLMQTELGIEVGNRTVLVFAAFPTAMFLAVGYSESLFLLLSVSCLYLARRGQWWLAGLFGALAGVTRVIGVVLALALLYEYLRQRGFNWRKVRLDVLAIGLVPVGLVLYMLFLWRHYGDPLIFTKVQAEWGRQTAAPWVGIIDAAKSISFAPGRQSLAWRNIMDLASVFIMLTLLVLSLVGPWKLRRDQFFILLFGAVPFLFAMCQPLLHHGAALASINRYALAVIPAFMVLAKMLHKRAALEAYLFACLPIQAGLLLIFIGRGWAG